MVPVEAVLDVPAAVSGRTVCPSPLSSWSLIRTSDLGSFLNGMRPLFPEALGLQQGLLVPGLLAFCPDTLRLSPWGPSGVAGDAKASTLEWFAASQGSPPKTKTMYKLLIVHDGPMDQTFRY